MRSGKGPQDPLPETEVGRWKGLHRTEWKGIGTEWNRMDCAGWSIVAVLSGQCLRADVDGYL